jgi:predicted Zn-dependent peptidase
VGSTTLALEDSQAIAQYYGARQLLEHSLVSPEEELKQLSAVTLADVQRVAKRLILPGEARLAVIGPYKASEEERFRSLVQTIS